MVFFFSVPTGLLINMIGRRKTVLLSLLVITLALIVPAIGYSFTFMLLSFSLLGIDALPGVDGGIQQVLDGKLKATFIYPTGGDKVIYLAMDILQKRPLPIS